MGEILNKRLSRLCDPHSLQECLAHPGSVYFTGKALIEGRKVIVIASDPEPPPQPPDLPKSLARTINALRLADNERCPVISLFDSPAPYQSGHTAFQGSQIDLMMGPESIGREYFEYCRLATKVPLIHAVFGNMAQAQAFPVAMGHGVVMLEKTALSVARPDAVAAMLGEDVTYQELGGTRIHSQITGSCHHVTESEDELLDWVRRFSSYLPTHSGILPPKSLPVEPNINARPIETIIPSRLKQAFDVHEVIDSLVDDQQFLELGKLHAGEVVTGLARFEGLPAGVVANNPIIRGGVLFPETCRKIMRFITLCDTFNLPILFLADAPGFMIGKAVEEAGIVQAGADLFSHIARCRTQRLCLVLRRAYTAGLYAMSGSGFDPYAIYALPDATISVYGSEATDRFLANLKITSDEKESIRTRMTDECHLETQVKQGFLTGILQPDEVREAITKFINYARTNSAGLFATENRDGI